MFVVYRAAPAGALDNNESQTECADAFGGGGPVAEEYCLTVEPTRALNQVGDFHSINVELTEDGEPAVEERIDLEVIDGPNTGTVDDDFTDSNGFASVGYQGFIEGTDTIRISWTDDNEEDPTVISIDVEKIWVDCFEEEIPQGSIERQFQAVSPLSACFQFLDESPPQCCDFERPPRGDVATQAEEDENPPGGGGGCGGGGGPSDGDDVVNRLQGPGRIDTAIDISNDDFPSGSELAVIARADLFPDALAGTPLAVEHDAPLLLNPTDALDPSVAAELERLGVTDVIILGGEDAIEPAVEEAINAMGIDTSRVAGATRFLTAIEIADDLGNPTKIMLASGLDFPDAATAGVAAAKAGGAVLLTNGDEQSSDTAGYLDAHSPPTVYAIGGPAADAEPGAEAIAGADRFETASEVAREFFASPNKVGIATAENFPEALTGGVHIARKNGPLLLVTVDELPDSTLGYLTDHNNTINEGFVYGGTSAISDEVKDDVLAAIQ